MSASSIKDVFATDSKGKIIPLSERFNASQAQYDEKAHSVSVFDKIENSTTVLRSEEEYKKILSVGF